MIFFYQIFIRLFSFSVHVAFLFNAKARLFVNGRKNVFKELAALNNGQRTTDNGPIWFHCSSLGEFEQARPLIEKFRISDSGFRILITFFSPSGYEIRKNYEGADLVCYLPLDTKANAKKFISLLNPSKVFFVKYDFWYNYLNELHERKIPTYLISANFREEQFKGFYGEYLKRVLKFFNKIFVQNELSQNILSANGISNVIVNGDLRFDRVFQTASSVKKNHIVEMFKGESKILIGGSTWGKDEEIIANCGFKIADLKFIIAPHEINESHIQKIISLFPNSLRFSDISKEPVSTALGKLQNAKVLIIDNIGMLSSLYQYADIAYIGGGFGAGIHNILEAVAFGVPVIFGPNHHKFPEAKEIVEQGGGFAITNEKDFNKSIELLLSDEKILMMASMVCKNFVQQRRGGFRKNNTADLSSLNHIVFNSATNCVIAFFASPKNIDDFGL